MKILRTCFGQIESLLEQVGHQSEDRDKASQRRADDVEINERKCRHGGVSSF